MTSKMFIVPLGLAMAASPALAQDAAAPPAVEDIVVTARRTAESVQNVPISITALSANRLESLSLKTMMDISRFAPGLFISAQPTNSASLLISIRGQAPTDITLAQDTSVGIYVDEVYYPRSIGVTSNLLDIDRVEVLKGPQGTLFGRNTTGGAVSIATKRPDLDEVGGFAALTLGNYGRGEASGALNLPVAPGVAGLRIVGQVTNRDGYGEDSKGRDVQRQDSQAVRASFKYEPDGPFDLFVSADYLRLNDSGANAHITQVNPFPASAPLATPGGLLTAVAVQAGLAPNAAAVTVPIRLAARGLLQALIDQGDFYDGGTNQPQFTHFKGYGAMAAASLEVLPNVHLKSITAHRWNDRISLADVDGTPYDIVTANYHTKAKVFSQELQAVKNTNSGLDWIVGGYYSREKGSDLTSTSSIPPVNATNPSIFDADILNKSLAAFGQATVHLGNAIRFTGGLRWTRDTRGLVSRNRTALGCNIPVALRSGGACIANLKDSYSNLSYLLSGDIRPVQSVLLYAKTARGFKSGGQNLRGTIDLASFDPFGPEKVTEYEVGFKAGLLDRRLQINGALYHSDYSGIQRTAQYLSSTGSLQNRISNAARGRINGAELDLTSVIGPRVTLSASTAYTDAKYKSFSDFIGDRTAEPFPVPKWTYALAAAYAAPLDIGKLTLSANLTGQSRVNYRGSAVIADAVSQPAFSLLNGRLQLDIDDQQFSVAVFARNILQKHYIVSAFDLDRALGIDIAYRGDPRTFGIELKKRFGRG